ncbi:hypothetical protein HCG51_34955 (plasmid) [Tolypothrix sp. PCC 7910]|uniref:hypothetical protein n=1 Tax=Tolypothrix sp. PCC 7910 TaxID=2099387 RepID=UPI00142795F4|nr:hypothetical protein [Tolypothrix sp. PCC 7910]QIR41882.1 hypothetical protein HCG51_34955 [Tolypothrix sp. PCC 7910]
MTTEEQPSDGIKRSKGKFDPFKETRQWSAAVSEERCKRIARNIGKRLVEIIDTEDEPLPIICIFEDYPDD